MASCEPHRSSAYYSDDIRWCIIWQRHALGCTHNAIATNLNVDVSTVRRILDTFSATGTVSKKAYPAEQAFRKNHWASVAIHSPLFTEKAQYSSTWNYCWCQMHSRVGYHWKCCMQVSKIGITRQRLATYALQWDEELCQQFVADVFLYAQDMLVFIDKTGTNRMDTSEIWLQP